LDWLVLGDILKTACNIMDATNKGVNWWVGDGMGGLTMLSDTSDQVTCTVGQTDGHSSPNYTTRKANVQWDRIGPQATLLMPLKSLTGSIMVLCDLTGLITGRL